MILKDNEKELDYVSTLKEIQEKGKFVFKKGLKQIAVFNIDNQIFAIDNRCPHEGYPLDQGSFNDSCILTCNWHNWKFNLKDGQCLTGGDNVKTYNTFIEDNKVFIDLSEPSIEFIQTEILKGLKEAFEDKQYARISRELARLHYNNIDPLIAFKKAILWSYNKLEDGTTHSYAAGADWLKLYLQSESLENKIIYLTEAIEYMSFDSLRHNTYAYSENIKEWDYEQFIKAVESQNENTAIELINGAFLEGLHFNDIEKALVHIALDHYNDFGHSLIYTQKTAYLIEKLGTDIEKELTHSLIRSIIKATREDLLPEFKKYNLYLNQVGEKSKENDFFLKNVEHSMKLTNDLLQLNSPKEVYELLLTANAKNLLYFDLSYQDSTESKVSENIGWLDFTHAITFSNAVNQLCNKYPQFWRSGLIQMSCFNGRNVSYLDLNIKTDIYEFSDYINFKNQVMEKILDHGIPTPIFPAHILKTAIAIFNEYEKTANLELKKYLGISLNRFLQSPIKQKHAKRTIKQSLKLVSRDFK